jgi:hypothetical protein
MSVHVGEAVLYPGSTALLQLSILGSACITGESRNGITYFSQHAMSLLLDPFRSVMSSDQGQAQVRDVAEDALPKAFPESHSLKKSIRVPEDHLPQANGNWSYAASEDGKLST